MWNHQSFQPSLEVNQNFNVYIREGIDASETRRKTKPATVENQLPAAYLEPNRNSMQKPIGGYRKQIKTRQTPVLHSNSIYI
jgi:hypothetical protein